MDVTTEMTSLTEDLSTSMLENPVPNIVVTDSEETNLLSPPQRHRGSSVPMIVDAARKLTMSDGKYINGDYSCLDKTAKSNPNSRRERASSPSARRNSSSSSIDSGSAASSRKNSGTSDDDNWTLARSNQRYRRKSSADSAVTAFLQYGRRDRRASANALEILRTVCQERTAVIGGLGNSSNSNRDLSSPRSQSPVDNMQSKTSAGPAADALSTHLLPGFRVTGRRASFSPVTEVSDDIGEDSEKEIVRERHKSLSSLMAVVQASKQFSRLCQGKNTTVTVNSEMKSNQNTGTESLSNTNDRLRLGGHKSVGTIESEPSKSYSSDIESHRIGSSSDKAMAPPSDSVFTRQKMLSRRRTSLCNSLTGSPFLVANEAVPHGNVHSGASGKSSLTSRSPLAPPSNRKLNPDKNTTASKPYKGPPGNCKARADARTAGARLKRHLESMMSQMTTAERLQVEAERQKSSLASSTDLTTVEARQVGTNSEKRS